jgi:Ca2+-binding EF-hand superfamily protein
VFDEWATLRGTKQSWNINPDRITVVTTVYVPILYTNHLRLNNNSIRTQLQSTMSWIWSWGIDWLFNENGDIPEETMEEYRMLSGFKPKEIVRLHQIFIETITPQERISKEQFLAMPCIVNNPLKDRIALCFGFDEEKHSLDFQSFLSGIALFNSPGQRETKLKTMFRLQDFDNDGMIGKDDLIAYLKLLTESNLGAEDLEKVATHVLMESSSDDKQEFLSLTDFQRIVASLDFQARMLIPI